MGVRIIMNRAAGRDDRRPTPEALRDIFVIAGLPARVESVPPGAVGERVRAAVAERPEAIVVAGGDGTVSSAAAIVAGSGIPFGVVPLGTINMLARELCLPLDPLEACRVIAGERPRPIDLAQVNGRIFVNHASVGLYPRIAFERQREILHLGRGRLRATLTAFVRMLRRFPLLDVALESGGRVVEHRTPFVFVGNNAYEFDRFTAFRRPSLANGELGVYASLQTGRWGLLRLLLRALLGRLRPSEDFQTWRLPELRLAARRRRLPMVIDGELVRMRPPLVYRSLPGALSVLAPAQGGGTVPAAKTVGGGT
jgi:diacylglycerol kinase family enzyme